MSLKFRKLLLGCGLVVWAALPVAAQCPAKTTVSDTLYNADGSLASGRVVIAWPTFLIGTCQVIGGQVSVNVSAGALSVALYPNDAATPAGTSYRATYYLRSGKVTTEYWVVPTSATPVTLATVRSASVPVPTIMFSQAQVTNLVGDLAQKLELPSSCPVGKFLQANGSATPPQVSCVDGTGAPLASTTVSGTVKTDVDEADPLVYAKASTDTLLAGKANFSHVHSAADTTSGVFDPARLPNPTATSLGGVKSGSCSGTDKVTGLSTAGAITCAADQGGGSGSQHQINGVNLAANDPVNFQDSATILHSNPAAGAILADVKDAAITAAKLSVTNPSNAQLSGVGDANIAAGALSPNRIAGIAEVATNKGTANGYAALDALSKVAQDPANAQTTPAGSKIPLADGTGKIADGWLGSSVSLLGQTIEATEIADRFGSLPGGKLVTTSLVADPTANNCVKWGTGGKLGDAGAACGGGSGDNISVNGTAASDADFDDATPAAPANAVNVIWQKDAGTPNNISAHLVLTSIDGAGIGVSGAELVTASGEADFLASGALTCGASTQGKIQVHTTPLQYCDNAATPALQYAAYGNPSGESTAAANDSVTLTTDTTGDYVASITNGNGITGADGGSEAAALTLAVDWASSKTLTNTSLDVEGSGNSVTTVSKVWLEAAGCQNAAAALMWDTPVSNPAVAACTTGTNTQKGVADFADGSNLSMQRTLILPDDWTGNVDVKFKWLTPATTGSVVWQIAAACVADGETDDPAFATASTVTDAAKGTANQLNDAMITGWDIATNGGCAAGETWHIKLFRNSAHASDDLAATASLVGIELTLRRNQ